MDTGRDPGAPSVPTHALFDAAPIPAVLLDDSGCIRRANHGFARLLAAAPEALRGRSITDIIAADARASIAAVTAATATPALPLMLSIEHASDGPIPVEVFVAPDLQGAPGGLIVQLVDQRRHVERVAELDALAHQDDLTGLMNRRGLGGVGNQLLRIAKREDRTVTFLFIDVEGLKAINDQHGHSVGDDAIREAGSLLRGRSVTPTPSPATAVTSSASLPSPVDPPLRTGSGAGSRRPSRPTRRGDRARSACHSPSAWCTVGSTGRRVSAS